MTIQWIVIAVAMYYSNNMLYYSINLKKDAQGIFDDMKQMNDDIQTLKKNVMAPKENVPDEDLTSLVLELKSCIKSYRSIEKDNSAIKEKLHKVYGRSFFNR